MFTNSLFMSRSYSQPFILTKKCSFPNVSQVGAISGYFIVIMADSVKLFQFFQICQKFMAIFPSHSDETRRSLIIRRTLVLLGMAAYVLPTAAYLIFDAQSMFDFGIGMFCSLTGLCGAVVYSLLIWQSENTAKFFESCEQFIAKRKF